MNLEIVLKTALNFEIDLESVLETALDFKTKRDIEDRLYIDTNF